jgi:hypothetical protein
MILFTIILIVIARHYIVLTLLDYMCHPHGLNTVTLQLQEKSDHFPPSNNEVKNKDYGFLERETMYFHR